MYKQRQSGFGRQGEGGSSSSKITEGHRKKIDGLFLDLTTKEKERS